ncbi:MAG: hypothetical protein HDR88_14450 [Bacteroides sp.]|nr:hypothetical protein [Bacteroides sp.]
MNRFFQIRTMIALVAFGSFSASAQQTTPPSFKVGDLSDQFSSVRGVARYAAETSPIVAPPAGKATNYTREAFTYIVMGGMAFANPDTDGACTVIDGDDGFVYIGHPYASLVTNTWLKGERKGDRIIVSLPQLIYQVEYDDEIHNYYAYRMELLPSENENESWYYPTDSQELVYYVDSDSFYMEDNDDNTLLLGLCDIDGGWTGHGDMSQRYEPFTVEGVSIPADVTEQDWQLRSGAAGYFITYAENNNDVYIKGVVKEFPDKWVKGEIRENEVYFPSGQYLGVDEATQHYNFLSGATKEYYWNEEYEMELYHNVLADNMIFHKEDTRLWIDTTILVNKGMAAYNPLVTYTDMEMRPNPEEVVPYPANPQLTSFIEYNDMWGYGAIVFNLPALNMDGYILPVDNMYYMIYVNGEAWALYSDEYPGIEDETYLIPYNYDDGSFIRNYGVSHTFYYFLQDFDTIGVQSIYEKDGEFFGSQLVYYEIVSSGITKDTEDQKEEVAVEWYDLSGRKLSAPADGICLKLVRYSDGSTKTEKIAGRYKYIN